MPAKKREVERNSNFSFRSLRDDEFQANLIPFIEENASGFIWLHLNTSLPNKPFLDEKSVGFDALNHLFIVEFCQRSKSISFLIQIFDFFFLYI